MAFTAYQNYYEQLPGNKKDKSYILEKLPYAWNIFCWEYKLHRAHAIMQMLLNNIMLARKIILYAFLEIYYFLF